jgi:hypothetical protein
MARPATISETREQAIARWEASGYLDPSCRGCEQFYLSPKKPFDVFAPGHMASRSCESGKHPHCTCDVCF